jgi:outer membrane protein assembly factor BamB
MSLERRELMTAVGVPSGLVSWWTADNTAADQTGLNNATLYNGATYAAGEVGQAFSFDGVNDRAQAADSPSLALTGSMTIEGWVLVKGFPAGAPADHGEILFRGDDRGGLDPYSLSTEPNGTLNFQLTNASNHGASIAAPIATGQFVHVAATLDDATGEMKLYENGVVVAQAVTTVRPFAALDPASNPSIGIGNHGGYPNSPHNFPFYGLIDELSVYNRAISSTEVFGIYSAGSAGKVKAANYVAADFPSVVEGAAGTTTPLSFTIERVGSLAGQAVVNWTTADNTAKAGVDYVAASGQVVFQDGQSQATVSVTVIGNNTPEPNKTFWLNTSATGYASGGGLGMILNDDAAVSVADTTVTEGDTRLGSLGALVAAANNGGMDRSTGMTFGPDGNLYVGSLNTNEVLRYDGTSGAFLGSFVTAGSGGLNGPAVDGLIFRPDGRLYVASRNGNSVLRYDAATGSFLDTFVAPGSGGLLNPKGMIFAPDGSLLVSSGTNEVLRYDGTTGGFLGAFISAGSGGLNNPRSLAFGPDGNLYVASANSNQILRYNGTTGAFVNAFVAANSGGLTTPGDLLFSDGSLYVASQNTNQVLRYDATTGGFIEASVSAGNNGLDRPIGLLLDANQNLLVGSNAEILRFGHPYPAAFTVSLSYPSVTPVTVSYATADGTATSGSDFTPISDTLTFGPGETTKTVLVPILDDTLAEPAEAFTLNLSNASGGTIARAQGTGTIYDNDSTKFFVVNDSSSADQDYRYGRTGNALGNSALNTGNTAPRGAASTAAGDKVWVVDANKKVYVYSNSGALLGSWTAGGMANSAAPEGIATNGTDIWIVDDAKQDKVFRYTNASGRLSGSQNAASSFSLNGADSNPKDIVTDGSSLWVVDDGSSADKVFKYTLSGSMLGSWTLNAGSSPTGITLDPTNVGTLWVLDNATDRVYQYDNAAGLMSGSLWPTTSFALAAGNTNPQGIADPPARASVAVGSRTTRSMATAPTVAGRVGLAGSSWAPGTVSPVSLSALDHAFDGFRSGSLMGPGLDEIVADVFHARRRRAN